MFFQLLLVSLFLDYVEVARECKHRDFGNTGTVCVCNIDYCDTVDPVTQLKSGKYMIYTSNLIGKRFQKEVKTFVTTTSEGAEAIDHTKTYQTINGFGGTFTDAAGININSLDNQTKEHLMRSYFSSEGIEYNLGRVPMGSTDFGTRSYSYLDTPEPDCTLSAFALQDEDFSYKIPLILQAKNLTNNNLQLCASAWTAPTWMKTNGQQDGDGYLKKKYWQLWVDYFVKFLDLYKKLGIEFWSLTTGNEPSEAFFNADGINSVGWIPCEQSQWISNNLGPTIRNSKYSHIKLISHDDQRIFLPHVVYSLFSNEKTREYIDGIGIHWYWDEVTPAYWQSDIHNKYPDKFFLNTEACIDGKPLEKPVLLGSWTRGEKYAVNIIENLQHWSTGWLDWNMALDMTGGPSYINNKVDSPIIVNANASEFYKQPTFYALGHYSKFITRGSIRIGLANKQNGIWLIAFDRLDGATVIVAVNSQDSEAQIKLHDGGKGYIQEVITAKSFNTIIYW